MDLTEIALLLGRLQKTQEEMFDLLQSHVQTLQSQEGRLKTCETFVGRAKTIASWMATLGAGLWTIVSLRWFR